MFSFDTIYISIIIAGMFQCLRFWCKYVKCDCILFICDYVYMLIRFLILHVFYTLVYMCICIYTYARTHMRVCVCILFITKTTTVWSFSDSLLFKQVFIYLFKNQCNSWFYVSLCKILASIWCEFYITPRFSVQSPML